MATNREIKMEVLTLLQTLPVCKPNSAKTNWTVRCPYCGDSTKHRNEGHLSILINLDSDQPMLFRCFRCNETGLVSSDLLEDLGLCPNGEMRENLRKGFRRTLNTDYFNQKPMHYKVPEYPNQAIYLEKLKYISDRLDLPLDTQWAKGNKVLLGLYPFLEENKIYRIQGVSPTMMEILNQHFVGFLSSNNNRIILRNIHPDQIPQMRYYKMILNQNNISKNTFYAIPSGIDLMYTHPVHVHIAEGTFDILSIKYNMEHDPMQTHLYYASCGFNFNSIIRWLLAKGVNTDTCVHLYSDRDKSDYEHRKYINNPLNKIWIDHVYLHRNQDPAEKDYGVPRYKIQDSYIKLR